MKVVGTVLIKYEVEVDADDISEDAMSLYDSDVLITKAIDDKLPRGFYVESDIRVTSPTKAKV